VYLLKRKINEVSMKLILKETLKNFNL